MKKINKILGLSTLCASLAISGSTAYIVSKEYKVKLNGSLDQGGGNNNDNSVPVPKPPVAEINESVLNSIDFDTSSWDVNNFSADVVKKSIKKNSVPSNLNLDKLEVKLSNNGKINSMYVMGYYPFELLYPKEDGTLVQTPIHLSIDNNEYSREFFNSYNGKDFENQNWNKYLDELNSKAYPYSLRNKVEQSIINNNLEYYYYSPKNIVDNIFSTVDIGQILSATDVDIKIQNYAWSGFENKNNGISAFSFIFEANSKSLNQKLIAQLNFTPDYKLGIQNYVNKMTTENLVYKDIVSSFYKINIPAGEFKLTAFVTKNGVVRKHEYLSKRDYQIKADITDFKGYQS
ncbi:hypothetical protein [Malacoplasma iowae]|uniref:hypothetical protein n=1 Tax=Malacoplasma iowae TaxID=2116 RepID=UPI002A18DF4F|nr:hypothetical protein [Malacoplasma iowae]WPL40166.1 hypothetical protein QX183_01260 [Malacoplasma iowae]